MGEETDEYVTSSSKLRDTIKAYTGFDILNDAGDGYKDLYEIVLGIGQAWKDLGDLEKAALGEALGGKRNARGLFAIFDNLDVLQGAYSTAVNSAGSAMQEQEHYAESVQYSIDRTKASLEELAHDFLSSDLLKGLIEGANSFLKVVDSIISSLGTVKTLIAGIGIADFVRGIFTNNGLSAGIVEMLGNAKLDGGAKHTFLGTLGGLLTGSGVKNATKDAGEKIGETTVDAIGNAVSRAGTKTVGNAVGDIAEEAVAEAVGEAGGKALSGAIGDATGEAVSEAVSDAVGEGIANAGAKGAEEAAKKAATPAATSFASQFGAKLAAILSSPIAWVGLAAAGALIAKSIYTSYKNNLVKTANTATDKFQDRKDQISGYEERYASINEKLSSRDTSETERVQLRQQLIDLQREIVSGLGSEAAGIDVVNGKYEEQVGLMDRIVEKQAEKNLNDKDVQKAYKDAEDEMTKSRTYSLGEIFDMSDRTIGKKFFDSVKDEIDGLGLDLADGEGLWYDENSYEIKFKGDATEASQAISVVESQLEKFRDKYKDDDYVQGVLDGVSDGMQNAVKDNEEILGKYQENYKNFLEQEFYTDDATKNNRTALRDMARAATDLNTAIASGDTKTFNEALSAYEDINKTAEGFGDKYKVVFDDIRDTIDETGKSAMEFKDVLDDDGIIGKDNPLAKQADELKQAAEEVKKEGLSAIDLQDLDLTPQKASESLKKLAGAFDIAFNGTDEDNAKIKSLISTLVELGVVSDDVSNNIEATAEDSFESFRSSIIKDIANIDTLNGAIAESFSGKGLSYSIDESTGEVVGSVAEIKKAYGELMSDAGMDMSTLVENTANGMHLNQKALRALQSQLEAKNKLELNNQLEEAQKNVNDLQSRFSKMDQNQFPERYNKMKGELDAAKERLESARELQAAYEGATSAYQKWVTAQSGGEEGDMYNAIRETAFSRGDELLKQGLVGTNEFRSIAQLFSNEDLSTAPIDKIKEAYENGSKAVKSFFTEGYEGLNKFASDAASKGIEGIKEVYDEAGQLQGYAFENIDVNKIAEAYGVSASTIESIFRRMSDYGIEVQRYSGEASEDIQKLNQQATEAQKTLKDHVTEFKTAAEDTNAEMQKLQEGGNVDLFNRPQISTQKLVDAGWDKDEVGEGTATVYSSTYSNEDGTIAMNFTPILPDGSVMEPGKFTQYCEEVVAGVRDDDLQLKIGGTFEGEDAIAEADAAAERIHELQEEYYGLDGTSIDLDFNVEDLDTVPELENKIKELEDYQATLEVDSSEYEAAGVLLDQLKQKKDAVEQATNIPATYTDLENANTAMSQLQTRISEIQSYNATVDVGVDVQNDEQVQQLANEIAALPKEAQVKVGVSEENAGNAQAIVQQIQDNPASIKVTPDLVKDDLDQEGTIKYSTEITKPLPESELNKKGTITYNSKMGKALNPAQLNKKQTINQTTNVTKNETTNKTLNTTVTGNASQESAKIRNAIAGIPNQKVIVINAIDLATVKIQKVKSEKIKDKIFVVKATDSATAVIENVKGNNIPDKSFNVTANTTTAINAVTRIKNLVDGLRSKEITLTTKHKDINVANGTAHWQGTAGGYYSPKRNGSVGNSFINHYNGTAYARGNWGLKRDEPNALINELGPEIVVLCKLCYHVW